MARLKLDGLAVYHCISRTVAGAFLLDDEAKEVFRRMLWRVADFSGVEILAYCVMSNHFHVLVRIRGGQESPERAEILRRYEVLYNRTRPPGFPSVSELKEFFEKGGTEAERWESRLRARMGDVSAFMKTLKQRYSVWYNRRYQRFGTLWAERFRCLLVEGSPGAMSTVAAYIDLNPVRAHLVEDPAAYRWCSYAEAQAGKTAARRGLAATVGAREWSDDGDGVYRLILMGIGENAATENAGRIPDEIVDTVLKRGGTVSRSELLRCRVRYFSDGAVLGSAEFVRAIGAKWLRSAKNKDCERSARGRIPLSEFPLVTWRDLRKRSVAVPHVPESTT